MEHIFLTEIDILQVRHLKNIIYNIFYRLRLIESYGTGRGWMKLCRSNMSVKLTSSTSKGNRTLYARQEHKLQRG